MTITAIKITADKRVEDVEIDGYEDYRRHLEGWIEAVNLTFGTLWVNEEFLLGQYGPEDFNSIASDLCGIGGQPHLMLSGILGPALLTGGTDRGGETLGVTDAGRKAVQRIAREA